MDSLPGLEWNFMAALMRGIEYHSSEFLEDAYYMDERIAVDSCYQEDSVKTWEYPIIKRCRFEYFDYIDSTTGNYKPYSTPNQNTNHQQHWILG